MAVAPEFNDPLLPAQARLYRVGGAVRDQLLGLPVGEQDWVLTGVDVAAMLAAGFTQVGRDFPVFLHPQSHAEYALARTERKRGRGYHGFLVHADPAVSLEQDLARRDLTINAIAEDRNGRLIDPWGGCDDLARGWLRPVSDAFVEDPLRLLRLARFAARFMHLGFKPHLDSHAVCQQIVASGELRELAVERVWQETLRAMGSVHPECYLALLHQWGALDQIFGSRFAKLYRLNQAAVAWSLLAMTSRTGEPFVRFLAALLAMQADQALIEELGKRLKWSRSQSMLARRAVVSPAQPPIKPTAVLQWFDQIDLWRTPSALETQLLLQRVVAAWPQEISSRLRSAAQAALSVRAEQAMAKGLRGPELGQAIKRLRAEQVAQIMAGLSD